MEIKKLIALTASCVMALSVLCSCAQIPINHNENEPEVTTPQTTTEAEVTTTRDPNIPSNVITTTTPEVTTTTPAPTVSESESVEEVTSATPTQESAQTSETTPVQLPETTPASTNEEGKIVDDYKSDIVFNTEDPDELYEMFGLDRKERADYYSKISKEHNFPIVHISTENAAHILSDEEYMNCLVEIFNCDDKYIMDATSAGIRVRGNASAYYGKESSLKKLPTPYRIKFTEKQSVLGLNDSAPCKSWVLLRTFSTGVRDYMAYDLARAINEGDYYVSDAQIVQLYVNETYRGMFLVCEQTQANQYRVDINEAEIGYTGTDIGYLVELDNYATSEDYWFWLNYNKEEITDAYGETRVPKKYHYSIKNDLYSDEQLKFIERYFEVCYEVSLRAIKYGEYYKVNENFELILAQEEFDSAYDCISQVIDINSLVCMYMTHELTANPDLGSIFMAVDFGEHSRFPVLTWTAAWDFDWGYSDSGSADDGLYVVKFDTSHFINDLGLGDRSNPWFILFYSADWFRDLVKEKWVERYDAIVAVADETAEIVNNNRSDFNYDTFDSSSKASRAKSTVNWIYSRIEYLNELWG